MLYYKPLQQRLEKAPVWFQVLFGSLCAFGVYCCMYAFRKPFTVGAFSGLYFLGVPYKIWLIIAQVIGYMFSKFHGIRFISSLRQENRVLYITGFISIAWIALLFFALVPAPYNILFLFINGFPLGMVWGLVFSYLEGRKSTEIMGVVLSTSFIFSSGLVKTVGKYLLIDKDVTEWWMPFTTGAVFFPLMIAFAFLLNHLPAPTKDDIIVRSERSPMSRGDRREFIRYFLPGILLIVVTYTLLTVLRDFRDNFANELWIELGYGGQPLIFAESESWVSLAVLLSMAGLMLIRDNLKAFLANHFLIISGYVLSLLSTTFFLRGALPAQTWMILLGCGLYISYVPFNCLFFERMIATFRLKSNVGFIMYVSDAFGYLGSVSVLLIKEFSGLELSWLQFFVRLVVVISSVGIVGTIGASIYFKKKSIVKHTINKNAYAL